MFTLVLDDFGINFISRQDAFHLYRALEDLYVVTKDWEGANCLGLTLNWDFTNIKVYVSMTNYVEAALQKLKHQTPLKPQDPPTDGTCQRMAQLHSMQTQRIN